MLVGIAADHGGYELKEVIKTFLLANKYEVEDFGAHTLNEQDDYPDLIVPLALALANKNIDKAIAVCGSGVGASVAANKVAGVRAALINEHFSAHQGVEDDDMNMLCLGGRVTGKMAAQELVAAFLSAKFTGAERHLRRLKKVTDLETKI